MSPKIKSMNAVMCVSDVSVHRQVLLNNLFNEVKEILATMCKGKWLTAYYS